MKVKIAFKTKNAESVLEAVLILHICVLQFSTYMLIDLICCMIEREIRVDSQALHLLPHLPKLLLTAATI